MSPALEVADIFRRHGDLGRVERRVMGAIRACRTAVLGGHFVQCEDCSATRIAYNSCRNRHCPKCQRAARAQWFSERQAELGRLRQAAIQAGPNRCWLISAAKRIASPSPTVG